MLRKVVRVYQGKRVTSSIRSLMEKNRTALNATSNPSSKDIRKPNCPSNNNSILNFLSKIPSTESVENEVHKKIQSLENLKKEHEVSVQKMNSQISYVMNHFGQNDQVCKKQRKFVGELFEFNTMQINKLIDSRDSQDQLLIILSHLAVREQLNARSFSKIIMKLSLNNVFYVYETMKTNFKMIRNWENDTVKAQCEIALASRFKILKAYSMSSSIVRDNLMNSWLDLVKKSSLSNAYLKNLVRLLDGQVEYSFLVQSVLGTENIQFIFCFWELHSSDAFVREYLEKNQHQFNKYQGLFIEILTNPLVSTNNELLHTLASMSRKLGLSSPKLKKNEIDKVFAFVSLFINDIRESIEESDVEDLIELEKRFNNAKSSKENELLRENYDDLCFIKD